MDSPIDDSQMTFGMVAIPVQTHGASSYSSP
jgi:hypothetical protein